MTNMATIVPKDAYDFPAPLRNHIAENNAREAGLGFSYVSDFMKLLNEVETIAEELSKISTSKDGAKALRKRVAKVAFRLDAKHSDLDAALKQWRDYRNKLAASKSM